MDDNELKMEVIIMEKKTFTMIPTNNEEFYSKDERLDILHLYIVERVRGFETNKLTCYMSNEQFSQETNCSISTIKRAIKLLVDLNILWAGYHQESVKNKQRVLRIYNTAVQNEPLKQKIEVQNDTQRGSICTSERFKMTPSEVQNEPLVYYKQTNNKLLIDKDSEEIANAQKETKRELKDLDSSDLYEIIRKLEKRINYVDIQKEYNLQERVTKNTKSEAQSIINNRNYILEQQAEWERRKNEPQIDYSRLGRGKEKTKEELEAERIAQEAVEEFYNDSYEEPCEEIDYDKPSIALQMLAGMHKEAEAEDIWA